MTYGNIKRLERNAHGTNVHMDRMTYTYPEHSNRLTIVNDSVPDQTGIMDTDFDDMSEDFQYDLDGRLTVDPSAQIAHINWNAQGKVRFIGREEGSEKYTLVFHYDGMGNRVRKVVVPRDEFGETLPIPEWTFTYYIRDAQGNHLTTLERKFAEIDEDEAWDELHIKETVMYGSDRLGVRNWQKSEDAHPASLIAKRKFTHNGLNDYEDMPIAGDYTGSVITSTAPANYARHLEGLKRYELKNHLGNVLATVSDKRDVVDNALAVEYYTPKVDNPSFYYPFGSLMPGLSDLGGDHRYGFNGMEKDDEVKGNGNSLDFGARIYDPRIGRWLSPDPYEKLYTPIAPYAFALNSPIKLLDEDGNVVVDGDGNPVTITVVEGEDGSYSASFNFVEGTSETTKTNFMENGGRLIKAMIQIPTGREMVVEAVLSRDKIHYNISPEAKVREIVKEDGSTGKGYKLGSTRLKSIARDYQSGDITQLELDVTVFEGSIDKLSETGFAEYDDNDLTKDQKLGRTAGHETFHATNPLDVQRQVERKQLTSEEHQPARDIGSTMSKEYGERNKSK